MSIMLMLSMKIFSTIPPLPRVVLKRKPISVPRNTQFSIQMFLAPPLISLPITKPPCPWKTVLLRIQTFCVGTPRLRPDSSRPDLMQIASYPTSKELFSTRTLEHDSISSTSPFWAYQGFLIFTPLTVRFSHSKGCTFHPGEF